MSETIMLFVDPIDNPEWYDEDGILLWLPRFDEWSVTAITRGGDSAFLWMNRHGIVAEYEILGGRPHRNYEWNVTRPGFRGVWASDVHRTRWFKHAVTYEELTNEIFKPGEWPALQTKDGTVCLRGHHALNLSVRHPRVAAKLHRALRGRPVRRG